MPAKTGLKKHEVETLMVVRVPSGHLSDNALERFVTGGVDSLVLEDATFDRHEITDRLRRLAPDICVLVERGKQGSPQPQIGDGPANSPSWVCARPLPTQT